MRRKKRGISSTRAIKSVNERIKKIKLKHWLPFAILVSLLIISIFSHGFTDFFTEIGEPMGVANEAVAFINSNLVSGKVATLKSVYEENGLYVIKIKIDNQEFISYVTKDGKYLFPHGFNLKEKYNLAPQKVKT